MEGYNNNFIVLNPNLFADKVQLEVISSKLPNLITEENAKREVDTDRLASFRRSQGETTWEEERKYDKVRIGT